MANVSPCTDALEKTRRHRYATPMLTEAVQGEPRTIIVISDLHLGGAYPSKEHPRGFRMCSRPRLLAEFIGSLARREQTARLELVINGDFVDFLAEEYEGGFRPFAGNAEAAVRVLKRLCNAEERPEEALVFQALRALVADGHRLTILVGNHDVELAIPEVRGVLVGALGGPTPRLRFVDDEAYVVGGAHIEHGNRYDGFNAIAGGALEALRAGDTTAFQPPPGSHMVATVMNPLKKEYPFIDLLKPETEAAIPVLLALDPTKRRLLGRVAKLKYQAARRQRRIDAGDRVLIAADLSQDTRAEPELTPDQALDLLLREVLANDGGLRDSLQAVVATARVELIAPGRQDVAMTPEETFQLARLLLTGGDRVRTLKRVLAVLDRDLSFELKVEADDKFLKGAGDPDAEVRFVVFGHTHLKKAVNLGTRLYLNSGTWADLIPFPEWILRQSEHETEDIVLARLREFLKDMCEGNLDRWIEFRPAFVRLKFDGKRVVSAQLETFTSEQTATP